MTHHHRWAPVFINKSLLGNSHVMCLYIVCCSFCTKMAQLYITETIWSTILKDLQSGTLRKCLATPPLFLHGYTIIFIAGSYSHYKHYSEALLHKFWSTF